MGRVVKVQTNFTVGEVNPELRGRIDLNQFESALERARNVIINPRGIVDRRFGSKFVLRSLPPQPQHRALAWSHSSFLQLKPICFYFPAPAPISSRMECWLQISIAPEMIFSIAPVQSPV